MARLTEINGFLARFPPFGDDQSLPDEEIMDIAEYATPSTWQKAMIMHGFDPLDSTVSEFVEFCERLEFSETTDISKGKNSQADSKNGHNGAISHAKPTARGNLNRKRKEPEADASEKFCVYHNVYGHDTGRCKVVLAQAKRMRGTWEASRKKVHFNKDDPKSTKNKEELHTLVEDAVKRALKEKKRKTTEDNQFNIKEFENIDLSASDDSDTGNNK